VVVRISSITLSLGRSLKMMNYLYQNIGAAETPFDCTS